MCFSLNLCGVSQNNSLMAHTSAELSSEVEALLASNTYDLPIFLQYLKSFVLSGSEPSGKLLLPILLQALSHFTTSDFIACMALVPPQMHDKSAIETEIFALNDLETLLCTGEFVAFWELWTKTHKSNFVNGGCNTGLFEKEVRKQIVSVMSITTLSINTSEAAKYVNLSSAAEVVAFVKENGDALGVEGGVKVVVCDVDNIVFEKNVFNNPETDTKQQPVTFSDIVKIIT